MSKTTNILFFILFIVLPSFVISQEIKTFGVSDFDLRGNVKSCLVITDYGKEEYRFDEEGRLTNSITRFSETDYETTHYKYRNGELTEKRVENYRDNVFDKATSLAIFYDIDTTANRKITEKIVSYTQQLMEQNVYRYDSDGRLTRISRTDTDGTDHTSVAYDTVDGKTTVVQNLNGSPLKSVQSWEETAENGEALQMVLTQIYYDGTLNTKKKEVRNSDGKLVSSTESLYDESTEKWILQEEIFHTYDEKGMLAQTETRRRNTVSSKEYIYQFDGTENNNWVKEIVTPDNTYATRRITYYKTPVAEE